MKPPADEMKEYWSYIKKEINPWRKARAMTPISYTETKKLLRQIKTLGGKRNS